MIAHAPSITPTSFRGAESESIAPKMRVYSQAAIVGIGMCTPLGTTASDTWSALLAGRFIRDHSRVSIEFPGDACRIQALAALAAREATEAAGWGANVLSDPSTAMIVATSKGPIEQWLAAGRLGMAGVADLAGSLGNEIGLGSGARLTYSAACATSLHALVRAVLMIRAGEASRVLVVAAESSLHPLFVASFARLGVLPPPGHGCRPFDRSRAGFLMSEAAAAVCLEAAMSKADPVTSSARQTPAAEASIPPRRSVLIERFALGSDATHLTASDPDARALGEILAAVRCGAANLVHAHGTGTVSNDPIELREIQRVCCSSGDSPVIYSHKAALGHSLGASGLLSICINYLCHLSGLVPGNVRTERPLPSRLVLSQRNLTKRIGRSVALAAGFGGPMGAVAMRSETTL